MLKQLSLAAGLICGLVAVGCGDGGSALVPPFVPTPFDDVQSGVSGGATITGTVSLPGGVQSGVAVMTVGGPAGLTVSVVGTSLGAVADAAGRFLLESVPPGDVQLRFQGSGVDATLMLPDVQVGQTVTIVVFVAGDSASIDSDTRTDAVDDDSKDDDAVDDDSKDDDSVDDSVDDDSRDDDSVDDDSKDDDSVDDDSKDDDSVDDDSDDGD